MPRRNLLVVTALIEVGAGLLLLLAPFVFLTLLLGVAWAAPEVGIIARIAGVALLSLAVACWLARQDGLGRAGTGLVAGMLLYNVGVAALLVFAAIVVGLHGIALWPAVALHGAMAVWCLLCLRSR